MKGFETKTPIVAHDPVDKNQSVLEATAGCTVAKCYVKTENIQIFVICAINRCTTRYLWNSGVSYQ